MSFHQGLGKDWQDVLKAEYTACLERLDEEEGEGFVTKEELALRYEKVARVL